MLNKEIKDIRELLEKGIEQNYTLKYEYLLDSNDDIDFSIIDDCFDYTEDYPSKYTPEGILILEAYIMLQRIKAKGITEDNYNNKEYALENALKNINDITFTKVDTLVMPPRPSQVIYALKYFLMDQFKYKKEVVKSILDVVANKEIVKGLSRRIPRTKCELDEQIRHTQEHKKILFNNTEGKEKWKYLGLSIFDVPELSPHINTTYMY